MLKNRLTRRVAFSFALGLLAAVGTPVALAVPQTASFTYQGELSNSGIAANGSYDFLFRLYDSAAGGAQVGATLGATINVVDGKFNTELDFGTPFSGDIRWLDIQVRPSGGGPYTLVVPRQKITSAPYGAFALSAGSATTAQNALALNGQPAAFYLNAGNLNAGTIPSARVSGNYTNAVNLSNAGNVFVGNGAALTGLNGSNITSGTFSDARYSANVPLKNTNNLFTASNTFSGSTPITVFDSNLSATPAFDMNSDGGTIFDIDVTGSAIVTRGFNVDIDSTTTKYAVDIGLTGTGLGYGVYCINSTPSGRGVYTFMNGTGATYGVFSSNSSDAGYGGYFNNTSATGTTYGIFTESNSPDGYGIYALHDASTGTAPAIYGETDSTTGLAYAIHGVVDSTAPGGSSCGLRGENRGTAGSGIGVWGSHNGTGWGLYGSSSGGMGVRGSGGTSGYGGYFFASGDGSYGVYGSATGTGSYGGYFTGSSGATALYVNGTTSTSILTIRGGADLAEKFEVMGTDEILPGMVVMIDAEHPGKVELASGSYNKKVAGVISGANELAAGMILGDFEGAVNAHPVALTGRVWTYVDASDKAVEPGDLMTTSDTPGYAKPVVDADRAHGATIGKAMSSLAKGEKGLVLVLVNLQ